MVELPDSEYQKLQARLNEASRMVTVVRDSNDAITIQDFAGKILAWNHGAEKMYGYSEQEAFKKNIWDLTPPNKVAEQKDFNRRLLAGEAVTSLETQRLTKNGRLLDVWLTVTKLVDEAGKVIGLASTERDITERKRAEEEIRRLNAGLEHKVAERTAELERSNGDLQQFANVASHDLQEPLRMIASYLQMIAQRYKGKLDKDADDFIDFAVDGAVRLQNMIEGLLAYARVESRGRPCEDVNCESVLNDVISNLDLVIKESGAVIDHDPLPVVKMDPSQLGQLFQNLIANALKFRSQAAPRIHISASNKEGAWLFSFKDNGIGIDPQYKDKIFVLFQRLQGVKYPGIGIGLAVAKRIIERQGGKIWVESELGRGATFYFTVPVK
jgi:PAS domain S-box-containing protein